MSLHRISPGKWKNNNCSYEQPYICQMDKGKTSGIKQVVVVFAYIQVRICGGESSAAFNSYISIDQEHLLSRKLEMRVAECENVYERHDLYSLVSCDFAWYRRKYACLPLIGCYGCSFISPMRIFSLFSFCFRPTDWHNAFRSGMRARLGSVLWRMLQALHGQGKTKHIKLNSRRVVIWITLHTSVYYAVCSKLAQHLSGYLAMLNNEYSGTCGTEIIVNHTFVNTAESSNVNNSGLVLACPYF